jgi:ABC-type amino acid transport substrate-binding protein
MYLAAVLALVLAAGCTKNTVVSTFPTSGGAVGELRQGKVDAVVGDYPAIAFAARDSAGALQVAGRQYDVATVGIGVAKNATALKDALEDGLRRIAADKTYAQILANWAVTEGAVEIAAPAASAPVVADVPQLKDGELKIGMELSYAPMEYYDETKREAGIDVELIQAIGKILGVQVALVDMPFDALIGAAETGKVDAIMSAITVTDERSQRLDFVPYIAIGSGILVQKGNPAGISTSVDLCQKRIAVQAGTSYETTMKALECQ